MAIQTAKSLEDIVAGITTVDELVADIAVASAEQSQGISQTNAGIGQIEVVTNHNREVAQENSEDSIDLKEKAIKLADILGSFKLR